jgi:hypothetical protein
MTLQVVAVAVALAEVQLPSSMQEQQCDSKLKETWYYF